MSQRSRPAGKPSPLYHLGQLLLQPDDLDGTVTGGTLSNTVRIANAWSAGQVVAGPPAWPQRGVQSCSQVSRAAEATGAGRSVCRRSTLSVHGNRGFPDGRSRVSLGGPRRRDLTVRSAGPNVCGRDETKPAVLIRHRPARRGRRVSRRHPGHPRSSHNCRQFPGETAL